MMDPILIGGVPRSGTTLVAGIFKACGVWTGETIPADKDNKKGYLENEDLVVLMREVFKGNGRFMKSVPPVLVDKTYTPEFKQRVLDCIDTEGPWLYKDSKLLLARGRWVKMFPNAMWILPIRNTEGILKSLAANANWSKRAKKAGPDFYKECIDCLRAQQIIAAAHHNRSLWIVTDIIMQGELSGAQEVIKKCGLTWNEPAVTEWIDRTLWHWGKK